MISIEISTDNAAFECDNERIEVARILKDLADRVESGCIEMNWQYTQGINDINGNRVGSFEIVL